jgi:ubiquinone/menaquinone biosynthesis C-methylase UbiE
LPFTIQDWHTRYKQQTVWTRQLRTYVYQKCDLKNAQRVLDAGCGTGALLDELRQNTKAAVYGIDIDLERLIFAMKNHSTIPFAGADIETLPFPDNYFDISLFHYVLLWVANPFQALMELRRTTRNGGFILAMAEPDYGGRIDYPTELEILGNLQRESLSHQGADPLIGRKLVQLFQQTALNEIECGVLSGTWNTDFDESGWDMEWKVIQNDIEQLSPQPATQLLSSLKQKDYQAYQNRTRILFVPTFYAIGKVDK